MYTEYSRKNEGYCQKTNALNIHKQVLLNLNHISYSSAYTAHIFCMYCMKVYGPLLTWVKHKPSGQINSALQINLILQPIWVPALRLPERQLLCSNRAPGAGCPRTQHVSAAADGTHCYHQTRDFSTTDRASASKPCTTTHLTSCRRHTLHRRM